MGRQIKERMKKEKDRKKMKNYRERKCQKQGRKEEKLYDKL